MTPTHKQGESLKKKTKEDCKWDGEPNYDNIDTNMGPEKQRNMKHFIHIQSMEITNEKETRNIYKKEQKTLQKLQTKQPEKTKEIGKWELKEVKDPMSNNEPSIIGAVQLADKSTAPTSHPPEKATQVWILARSDEPKY